MTTSLMHEQCQQKKKVSATFSCKNCNTALLNKHSWAEFLVVYFWRSDNYPVTNTTCINTVLVGVNTIGTMCTEILQKACHKELVGIPTKKLGEQCPMHFHCEKARCIAEVLSCKCNSKTMLPNVGDRQTFICAFSILLSDSCIKPIAGKCIVTTWPYNLIRFSFINK